MNKDYGKVVNFVQVPPPFGVEGEPHHMQYEWQPGQPIVAGHLFTDLTTIWDVTDIPNITLKNIIRGEENPLGAFPDAYDFVGDTAIGTYMTRRRAQLRRLPGLGRGLQARRRQGHGPGRPRPRPASSEPSSAATRAASPSPARPEEARPMGTCGNPHGIQARPDLDRMVTNDYADARELGSDPLKTVQQNAFRPTSRIWDIADPTHPKLISVAHMPKSSKHPTNPAHDNIGIMERGQDLRPVQGHVRRSMCGGGIFFLPDVTNVQPDSSQPVEAGLGRRHDRAAGARPRPAVARAPATATSRALRRRRLDQVSHDNRFLFRTVGGRNPGSTNTFDNGTPEDDLLDQHREADQARRARPARSTAASTPAARSVRATATRPTARRWPACSPSTTTPPAARTGPALDNHNLTPTGAPTRMMFCDYFVARTGYDGNHRCYMANVDPDTGALSYDTTFRDENTGALGIDFNRSDWPGHPDAGFYKPHSMVWVVPEAVGGAG